ncbi:MAG: ChaN family lipoprotein [Vicinamibacteria bacterium]|nr:ChaN family lipoprotein [Vicinamibacteria bacterium]
MKRLLLGLAVACPLAAYAQEPSNLPIGDPLRKDKTVELVLDGINDAATGDLITPKDLAARLAGVRLVFVGESHTSIEYHNVQRRLIEELTAAGRKVFVGLEMYPYTEQAWLDKWSSGELSEDAFLKDSRWYKNWGYHWLYYRDIFTFSRDHKIRMFGVNTPREVVAAVRKKGFANLTPEEAARILSKIDTDSAEHKRLFKAYFSPEDSLHTTGMTDEQFNAMYNAQATWDATMGYNAVQALQKFGDKDTIMVVLIGSGHVAYGLGAERQAKLWFDGNIASVIPMATANDKGEKPVVRASYANFIWGVAPEKASLFPTLGFSTGQKKDDAYPIIAVQPDSIAAKAGFKVGDILVSMDGVALTESETTNRLMSEKRWGDAAEFKVKRGDEEVTLKAYFRRTL